MQPNDNLRDYSARVSLPGRVFHSTEGAYLYPLEDIVRGSELQFGLLSEASGTQPFHVLHSPLALCFVVPVMKVTNLGTALLLTYPSWQTSHGRSLSPSEVYQSFKHPSGLYAFSALNKVTLVTSSNIDPGLHEFLTLM